MREADDNETSGELGSAFDGAVTVENTIVRSVDLVGHFCSCIG